MHLLRFIATKKLCGKNRATIIFDGYPHAADSPEDEDNISVVFSRSQSADEKIKKIVESFGNPKNIVVVSDDNEIRFFVRSAGAKAMGVEEFINRADNSASKKVMPPEAELTFSQMEEINRELREKWLK